ncbi:winged helix-turn-helix domain-containing protein [Streptomyces sp. NPDC020800]|uniref:winged helix-turn-helix domain-containing protein n=1 Tax=Streptomyces sp. NPDC020800 TaxID=3365092 RepID=UPI00379FC0C8
MTGMVRATGSGRVVAVWERRGLSARMRRLLLEGDAEGRYAGHNESDAGFRMTMALAVGCSQPGRAWSPADFFEALIYTPTPGGVWARRLRERKGSSYAEAKLTAMLEKARTLVAGSPEIRSRDDALEVVGAVRRRVESVCWRARGGGDTDFKNLVARLELCEREGGLDHTVSVRRLAELMGCAKATAEASTARLLKAGWLVMKASGSGKDHGTRWLLKVPDSPDAGRGSEGGARLGQLPTSGERGEDTVPAVHIDGSVRTDSRDLGAVMGHDAFHRFGHGTSGARLLACLDAVDGISGTELQTATGLHRTTVARRMSALVADGLVAELDGLYYLAAALAVPGRLHPDPDVLAQSAEQRGTSGLAARRRERHARDRSHYLNWLKERAERRRPAGPRLALVPEGVLDPDTGELLDPRWAGWHVADRHHPVWFDDPSPEPEAAGAGAACA